MKSHISNCFDVIHDVFANHPVAQLPTIKAHITYSVEQVTPALDSTPLPTLLDWLKHEDKTFPLLTRFGIFFCVYGKGELIVKKTHCRGIDHPCPTQPTRLKTPFTLNPDYLPPFLVPFSGFPQKRIGEHFVVSWASFNQVLTVNTKEPSIKDYTFLLQ